MSGGRKSESNGGHSKGLHVHQRVEKLGMVTEVVTTKSVEALDSYLRDKQFNVRAADITALAPYLREEYTLVCSWAARPTEQMAARAVRIDFPTRHVFYPLRPTSVYEADVDTHLYVQGWVRPAEGVKLPGLRCEYLMGTVQRGGSPDTPSESKRVTRVQLDKRASGWSQDLILEEGTPNAVAVAEEINELYQGDGWLILHSL